MGLHAGDVAAQVGKQGKRNRTQVGHSCFVSCTFKEKRSRHSQAGEYVGEVGAKGKKINIYFIESCSLELGVF